MERLRGKTRETIYQWCEKRGLLGPPVIDPADELILAMRHPAVQGFMGPATVNDKIAAMFAFAGVQGFNDEQMMKVRQEAERLRATASRGDVTGETQPSSVPADARLATRTGTP